MRGQKVSRCEPAWTQGNGYTLRPAAALLLYQTMPKKRIPLALLHAIASLLCLLKAGGPYLLISEAEGEFGLRGAVVGPSEVLGVDTAP